MAFLGKGAFVDQQHRFRTAEQRVGLLGDRLAEPVPVDRGFRQHVLHRLMIDLIDFAHAQHVGPFRLEQPAHIAAKRRRSVAGAGDEKRGETLQRRVERRWKALKGRNKAGRGIFTPSS